MTPAEGPILVAFGRHEIAIRAADAEVAATLRRDHRHLPGSASRPPDLELDIVQQVDRFVCTDSLGLRVERPTARWAVRWARHRVLESIVGAYPELLWLHGGAAGLGAGAVLIVGPRGRGKSTLVTALCAQGASYLSDDILAIDPSAFAVHPFPRAPEVRIDPGEEMPPEWLLEVSKSEVEVDAIVERSALPIRAVLLPYATRGRGVSITACSPAEAVMEIAHCCWNFADHGAQAAAGTIGRLASGVPVMRVAFDDGAAAAEAIRSRLDDAQR